ncbi:MAG: DUF1361 domain-containing protein [Spirochaetota bacterium]|nr:DUF1361 domain-containing protein [Spirochaetota bacterium]
MALYSLSIFAITLSVTRVIYTQNLSYLFMIWNLFLAWIPYWISNSKFKVAKNNNIRIVLFIGIWLLFLPNAPYLITDIIHFKATSKTKWLDLIVLCSYTLCGMLLFYLSLKQFTNCFLLKKSKIIQHLTSLTILLLSAYGIYLGRELRFNSWDIISNPIELINSVFSSVFNVNKILHTGALTFIFALFLYVSVLVFDYLLHPTNEKEN